jgi:serine/threonine protein kinase
MADSDDRARFEARLGTTLGGKWRLDRLIGIGGMAAVYSASHRNGAHAAIKILHAQFARRADARTRFLREAYIANKAGKGAVAVLDDDVDDAGAPYLVMDLLRGEPVDVRAKRLGGKLPLQEVLWIATQVLATLEHAHEHGIVHRDLKPDNLFWTTDQVLKVLDFGVARLRDANTTETTRTGVVVGTPMFMAPEQALGSTSEIDARTDLWSLGAIMFRLLTGRHVHPSAQVNALVIAATKRAPSIASVDETVPAKVAVVVDTALQFEREKRYDSAHDMRVAIEAATGPEPPRKSLMAMPRAEPTDGPPPPSRPPADDADRGLATGMSHDDSIALHDLLRLIGDAVLARKEHGPGHTTTIRKVDMAFRTAVRSLTDAHIGLFWNVLPEGFVAGGQLVWMAKPPLPSTPEQMYDDGVRVLGLLPGIAKAEFEEVVRMIGGDLAPFSDYATFLHASPLGHVVHRIDPTKPGMPEHESLSLEPSSGANVGAMLGALGESEDAALRVTLLGRLERWGEGHEAEIRGVLATAGIELAVGLLRVLHVLETDQAREAIETATASAHAFVRIVALSYLEAGDRLQTELRAVLRAEDPRVRLDALVSIERYRVVPAGPALAQHIRADTFDALPLEERRQAFSALGALTPLRAEAIAIELLRKASTPEHESTREVAAELLGSIAEGPDAREALEAVAEAAAGTSNQVRDAAASAIISFDTRAKLTEVQGETRS